MRLFPYECNHVHYFVRVILRRSVSEIFHVYAGRTRPPCATAREALAAMQTLTQGLPGWTIAFAGPNGIGKTFNINRLMLATEQDARTYQRVKGAKEDMQLLTTMEGVMQLW
jgi:hypothetical protein